MPYELTLPGSNRNDDLRDVAYQPHHVRGLQAEVTAFVNDCLQELENICESLRTPGSPPAMPVSPPREFSPPRDLNREPDSAATVPTSPESAPMPAESGPESLGDFDARLAKLKRMIAERLTDDEPGIESRMSEVGGQG